ncbi:hypothetical protein B0O80DRAFT_289988 [Mortierella sp. GBAus27b]|nr:hypothetical protein B0O80DRAFT_289988 [Mortierella sp. GBAus27b]
MTSARPLRTSARQSALRQEQEAAELARQRDRISANKSKGRLGGSHHHRHNHHHDHELGSDSSSSRSLSPALSDSASLSSGGEGGGGRGEEVEGEQSDSETYHRVRKRARADGGQDMHGNGGAVDGDDDDPTQPFSDPNLQSYWEIAFVYGFLLKFRPLLRQNSPLQEISMESLEEGLLSRTPNACIEEVHTNLLSNLVNRKKGVDGGAWQRVFMDTLDAKHKSNDLEYDYNPLRYYRDYYRIPPEDRVHLLKALVHWVLQEGPVIRNGIEEDNEYYVIEPFGADQAKRVYWYFGGTFRIFRETKNPKKKSTGWETVAVNLDEIKVLADSFEGTSSKPEKALQIRLREEIIQPAEERIIQNQLKQERLEKRMHKLAQLHELAATRTTRTRSCRVNQPKYTFDDDEDEFEDEYDMYKRPSSRRNQGKEETQQEEEASSNSGSSSLLAQNNHHDSTLGNHVDHHHHRHQQQHVLERPQERSGSAEAGSSGRSSVARDSDTSILDALQRTRVRDDDSFVVDADDDGNNGVKLEDDRYPVEQQGGEGPRKVGLVLQELVSSSRPVTLVQSATTTLPVPTLPLASLPARAPAEPAKPEPTEPAPVVPTPPVVPAPVVSAPVVPAPVVPAPIVPAPASTPALSSLPTEDIEMSDEA